MIEFNGKFIMEFGPDLLTLDDVERIYIEFVLDKMEWQKNKVAEILGVNRRTLYRKLKKWGINERNLIENTRKIY